MDMITKLSMIALIGVLVAGIVFYHVWLDGQLTRRRRRRPADGVEPARATRGSIEEAR
jgi:hypothetical protein